MDMAGQIINVEGHRRNALNTGVGHPEPESDLLHRSMVDRIKIGGKQIGFHGKDRCRLVQDYPLGKGLSMTPVIATADF
jgi:hypothetical protein